MNKLFVLLIVTATGPVPNSLHATQQACEGWAYVLYERDETRAECHVIETDLTTQCTTDSSCEMFHGF